MGARIIQLTSGGAMRRLCGTSGIKENDGGILTVMILLTVDTSVFLIVLYFMFFRSFIDHHVTNC